MGTSSNNGTFTMVFSGKNITKVELVCFDWYKKSASHPTNSNYFVVNGQKLLAPYNESGTAETLTFEGSFGSEVTIATQGRGFLFAIKVYGA